MCCSRLGGWTGILKTVMDIISLSSGQQIALAIAVNILAVVMLWGPYGWFRWHYRKKEHVSWRARLGVFLVFVVLFALFWWGYLCLNRLTLDNGETMREVFNSNFFIEIITFFSLPVYFYNLFFSHKKKGSHFLRILIISSGFLIAFGLYIWFVGYMGVRFFG